MSSAKSTAVPRRIGRGFYLVVWAAICAAQLAVWQPMAAAFEAGGNDALPPYLVLLFVLQGCKLWPTLRRLADLGRSPDDALWTFVPVVNASLWWWLVQPTPPDDAREARRARWAAKPMLLELVRDGFSRWTRAPLALAGGLVWLALIAFGEFVLLEALRTADAAARESTSSLFTMLGGAGVIWLLLLALRRGRDPVGAWLWAWAGLASLLVAGAFSVPVGAGDGGLLAMVLLQMGALALAEIFGGLAIAAWIGALSEPLPRGGRAAVMATLGLRSLLTSAGYQILVPGLICAAAWITAPIRAARRPHGSPLREAWGGTRGRFGLLLRVFVVYLMFGFVAQSTVLVAMGRADQVFSMVVDTASIGLPAYVGMAVGWAIATAWLTAVALILVEREAKEAS